MGVFSAKWFLPFGLCVLCLMTLVSRPGLSLAQLANDPSVDNTEYRIGPEDVLRIRVWGRPDLSSDVTVGSNGTLQLPLVGVITADSKTPTRLGEELLETYSIQDPAISEVLVTVLEYNSRRITVVGEVLNPGPYSFREIPKIWGVVLRAGGAKPTADLSRVQIVRKNRGPGESASLVLDLSGGVATMDDPSIPELRPQDTLIVPSLVVGGSTTNTIHVLGSVKNPGVYPVSSAETVVKALAVSGGTLPEANLSKIMLTRKTETGVAAYRLDVSGHLNEGKPLADVDLRPGDTLTIPGGGASLGSILQGIVPVASILTAISSILILAS